MNTTPNTSSARPVLEVIRICPSLEKPVQARGHRIAHIVVGNGGDFKLSTRSFAVDVYATAAGHILGAVTYETDSTAEYRGGKITLVHDNGYLAENRSEGVSEFLDRLDQFEIEDVTWLSECAPKGTEGWDDHLDIRNEVDRLWTELIAKAHGELSDGMDWDAEAAKLRM